MVLIEINGVHIDFPFQPYKCQIDYMQKVLTCLQEGKHGVLESPTGTGKTLCLLCAALAWRETLVAGAQLTQGVMKAENPEFQKNLEQTLSSAGGKGIKQFIPKIIYASRTHSQLSQAVNELKNTIYRPKISVLGSRDQMCINPGVNKLESSTAKVFACKAKLATRSCMFFNNLEAHAENTEFSETVLDIEDLGKLGDKHKVCPYFMSRELQSNADLIFMPYNYVLDFKSRKANSIDLNSSIILLDEAHNVGKMCEESASFDLTSYDLACCHHDCDSCIKILKERESFEGDEDGASANDLAPEDALHLKNIFSKIEDTVVNEVKLEDGQFKAEGSYLYSQLGKLNVNASTVMQILDVMEKCNALLASDTSSPHAGPHKRKNFAIQKVADILKILFCRTGEPKGQNLEVSRYYKVFIHVEKISDAQRETLDPWNQDKRAEKKEGRTLSYWCFHPGLAMKELVKQGVRSLILTSGTLSPLDSFTSELDVPFPIQLQNPHVIGPEQIWAGIIQRGPDGTELNSSYHTRFTDKYLNSLGSLLSNFARTTPNGLLVFFPSYLVMDKSLEFWRDCGLMQRIEQHKAYFSEPKNKKMLNETMEQFYDKIKDPKLKGAIFFAVCRGKVSEGLDFANENGRIVVITGLPFPPKMDPRVKLKMKYLDDSRSKTPFTGRQWYRQQASRAVNQAVGRVIRHSKDFGAICLCDVRFTYADAQAQLPIWIKPHVQIYNEFGSAQGSVVQFFRIAKSYVTPTNSTKDDTASRRALPSADLAWKDSGTRKTGQALVRIHPKSAMQHRSFAVPSYNSDAKYSLAALKGGEASATMKSVFTSLSSAGVKKDALTSISGSSMSETILHTKCNVEEPRGKGRKIKMVMRKSENAADGSKVSKMELAAGISKDVVMIGKSESSTDQAENRKLERHGKAKNPEKYYQAVKDSLPPDEYKKFGKIIIGYKKRKNDMNYLMTHFTALFKNNIASSHLLDGFREFVKDENKAYFNAAMDKFREEVKDVQRKLDEAKRNSQPEPKRHKMDPSQIKGDGEAKKTKHDYDDFFPTLSDDDDPSLESGSLEDLLHRDCIVCNETAKAPHRAACGHIACFRCWLEELRKEKMCPKCHLKIRHRGLTKIFFS